MTPTMTKPTDTTPRTGQQLVREDLMLVTPREAAARLGGYDTPAQVAAEQGLEITDVNRRVVDLGPFAGALVDDELELGDFSIVSRGRR